MRNLILFLARNSSLFVFITLECLALILLVQKGNQQVIFWHSANQVSGTFYKWKSGTAQYMRLKPINQDLVDKISNYKELETYYESQGKTFRPAGNDTLKDMVYRYLPAKVINNSTNRNNNFLTLDVGSAAGVEKNTGVVSGDGLVGIVMQTSKNYSAVMSLLHREVKISAEVKRSGYFGSLIWKRNDPRIMYLEAIPQHAVIEKGDTVITSGYSSIFPPGHMIGVVDTSWVDPGSNFHTILVELSCDLAKLEYAYVVKHPLRLEKQELEEAVGYE